MKKILLLIAMVLLLSSCGGSDKEEATETTETTEKAPEITEEEVSEINLAINERFMQDLGWATGKLDENANEIENGTPNPDYAYSLFIDKVEYNADDNLNVYVNSDFNSISEEDKKMVIDRAQSMASPVIPKYEGTVNKPFTVVYSGTEQIGSSSALDTTEINFD